MGTLSTSVNRGNGAFSLAAKGVNKDLLINNICGGCTFLGTFALLYLSVTTLHELCEIRYKLGKLLNPSIILDLAQAAKKTRSQQLRQDFREEEELDRDAQHGIQIQTMPKTAKIITVYQLSSITRSAIALFLAIIGFKKQIQASFFDTPIMLLSPFIMSTALSKEKERLNSMTLETNGQRRVVLCANTYTVPCTNRDAMHFKTLDHFAKCSVWLLLTSLFYSVSIYTYKFSSGWYTSYVPIVIAFVNLFVMLYKFILDCHYIHNCVEDNKTRLILMGITTPIKDKNETPKKLSRIRVTGKIKELIDEFKNKESQCLALQERLDPFTQRVELQIFQMHAMIMKYAIKTIGENTGYGSFTINMDIGCKSNKRITNPVLYATTLNGSNTCVMSEDELKKYEFKGSDAKIQNQYVDLEKNKEEDTHLLEALHITDITCLSTNIGSAINLVDLIAVGILVKKIPDMAQMDEKDKEIGKDFITRIEKVVPRFSYVSVAVAR